jgi:ABC-type nitrate/sulfonate/bicarbonate transport system permease component
MMDEIATTRTSLDAAKRSTPRFSPALARGLAGMLILVALGEVLPRSGLLPRQYVPTSSEVVLALGRELTRPDFWSAMGNTVLGWSLGLTIAAVLGLVLGLLLGSTRVVRELTSSTIEFLRPIPSVALIPLAILMFGATLESKLLLVVYAAFWQMLVQTVHGVQDVDPVARETAIVYHLSPFARIRHVTWPTALPYVMTGLRLSAAVALILTITAELVIGNPGLGNQLAVAQSGGDVATAYALIVVTGLLGVTVNLLARRVERRTLSWHTSQRREVPV